jgi:dTDP-4-amino-4,6-dideoxygalactose transaminase
MTTLTNTPVRTKPFPSWPQYGPEELAGLTGVLESGIWSDANGPAVQAVQDAYAGFVQADYAVAVSNGTVAIVLALRALGIGAGDEVIVPPYTFLATATAVLEVSAMPIFVDIDPDTWCIDPDAVEAAITERTRAIIPVHLGGQSADLDRLQEIATRHGLFLIEDCAHAHGSTWKDRRVGAIADLGTWSFQASKNLNCGEGGMVTTNDPKIAETIESLRNCGRKKGGLWYAHYIMSGNFRLTEWQSTILHSQLRRYPEQLERRNGNGQYLDSELSQIEGLSPLKRDPRATTHSYHLYQFRYDARAFGGLSKADFIDQVRAEGIPVSAGYPLPLYKQPLFLDRAFDTKAAGYDPSYPATQFDKLDLPNCEAACANGVWIPQTVLLDDRSGMGDIVEAIRKVQKRAR